MIKPFHAYFPTLLFPFPGINFGLALWSSFTGEAFCKSVQVKWDLLSYASVLTAFSNFASPLVWG